MTWQIAVEQRCWVDHDKREAISFHAAAELEITNPMLLNSNELYSRATRRLLTVWYDRHFPEKREPCFDCDGRGWKIGFDGETKVRCGVCNGKGYMVFAYAEAVQEPVAEIVEES